MANESFKTVVRRRAMRCARSSVIDEGLEDNIVRPHPEQEVEQEVVQNMFGCKNMSFLSTGSRPA